MPSASIPETMTSATPSVLEINMRRLMAKCDTKAYGVDRILQGSEQTKYLNNIKTLREMLAVLEEDLSRSGKLDGTVLGNYAAKIDTLASVVELSAAGPIIGKGLMQPRMIEAKDVGAIESDQLARRASYTQTQSVNITSQGQSGEVYKVSSVSSSTLNIDPSLGLRERRTGMPSDRSYNNLQNEKVLMGNNPRITDSRDTPRDQAQIEATLQNDRAQREEMEAGLSILMQQLRHNALAIHQTLVDEQTSGLLDEADQSLDNNISRLGKERTRLELYSKQSRKTKWMIWAIVLIVSLVFVFMFFIIRIF